MVRTLGLLAVGLSGLLHAASAQPLPLQRYRPIEVGDAWAYVREATETYPCWESPLTLTHVHGVVVADTTINDLPYKVLACEQRSAGGELLARGRTAARVLDAPMTWVDAVAVSGSVSACSAVIGRSPVEDTRSVTEPAAYAIGGTSYALEGVLRGGRICSPCGSGGAYSEYRFDYGADVGLLMYHVETGHPSAQRCSQSTDHLAWAKVGDASYGVPVAVEPPGPGGAALRLSVAPVPVGATLRLSLAGADRAAAAAYDVTGRRVFAGEVAGGALAVDASGWAPGLYVVRVTTADGRAATARVVRAD